MTDRAELRVCLCVFKLIRCKKKKEMTKHGSSHNAHVPIQHANTNENHNGKNTSKAPIYHTQKQNKTLMRHTTTTALRRPVKKYTRKNAAPTPQRGPLPPPPLPYYNRKTLQKKKCLTDQAYQRPATLYNPLLPHPVPHFHSPQNEKIQPSLNPTN